MIASPFRRAVPITFLDLCPVNGGCWPEIALQPGRDYEIPSRNYRDVRFYGSFPGKPSGGKRNRALEGSATIVLGACRNSVRFSTKIITAVANAIRVTVPERMRMESSTYRRSRPVSPWRDSHGRTMVCRCALYDGKGKE